MKYFINLSLLRHNRNFLFLYIGQTVSFIGTMITSVALPYQIYHETHSTLMVGLLSLAQLIPLLFTALIGGTFADRYHRKLLLIFSEVALAIGCLLLAWNATLAYTHIWILFLVATAMSATTGLHRPALDSIKQQIINKKDFAQAASLSAFMFGSTSILGPALGGWIIAHLGITVTFLVDFSTFIISLIAILLMSHIPKPNAATDQSTFASIKEGLRYAVSRQELLGSYVADFTAMIFGMPMALFPAIAMQFGGASTLGLLYSAPAAGAVVVSFLTGWVEKVKRHGAAIAISAVLWGVAIIFFGMATNLWIALFFLALAGAFDAISGIFRGILWNETIPTELRGRLSGIEMISYLSGPKLGDTEAGLVAAFGGITFSIISGGILCVVGVAACCYFLPKFWYYRSEDQDSLISTNASLNSSK